MSKEAEKYLSIYREKNALSDLFKDEHVSKEVSSIMQSYAEHYHSEKVESFTIENASDGDFCECNWPNYNSKKTFCKSCWHPVNMEELKEKE